MSTAFREAGALAARPWAAFGRLTGASLASVKRRHAAVAAARIFAQAEIGALDRDTARGEGLRIASLFTLGATDALARAVGLEPRDRRRVESETLGWLCGYGRLGAWRLRRALWRAVRRPEAAARLAAGGSAMRGWLQGQHPLPLLEELLHDGSPAPSERAAEPAAIAVRPAAQG